MKTFYAIKVEYGFHPRIIPAGYFLTIEEAITALISKARYNGRFIVDPGWFDDYIDSNGKIIMKDGEPTILRSFIGSDSNKNYIWIESIEISTNEKVNFVESLNDWKRFITDVEPITKKSKIYNDE